MGIDEICKSSAIINFSKIVDEKNIYTTDNSDFYFSVVYGTGSTDIPK
jgi:hypothetical protein